MSKLSHQHHLSVLPPTKQSPGPQMISPGSWSSSHLWCWGNKTLTHLESQFFTLQYGSNFHEPNQPHMMQFQHVIESILKSTEYCANVRRYHWLTVLRTETQGSSHRAGLSPTVPPGTDRGVTLSDRGPTVLSVQGHGAQDCQCRFHLPPSWSPGSSAT